MSGLVIKLAPNERILINGAVLENGEKRSRFSIKTPNANILRLRDAIHPEAANTPVSRACYTAQLILAGDLGAKEGGQVLLQQVEALSQVFDDRDSRSLIDEATHAVIEDNAYQALRALRSLMTREARLFASIRQ